MKGARGMVSLELNVAKLRRRNLLAMLFQLGVLLVLITLWVPAMTVFVARFRAQQTAGSGLAAIVAGVVGAAVILHLLRGFIWSARNKLRVVPYFKDKGFREKSNRKASAEAWDAFRAGSGIAADLSRLTDLAHELQVKPLADFGFADDLLRQETQWSDLTEGKRTVSALIARLKEDEAGAGVSAATLSDLQTLARALEKAGESQPSFCLLVRYGDDVFISGHEMEKRQGTFWF